MPARFLLLTALTALLAGCGFQLRGDYALPAAMERLVVSAPTQLRDELLVGLRASNVEVVSAGDEATASLDVGGEQFSERVLSVDPDSGKAREYEVAYTVDYRLTAGDGEVITPRQQVRLVRDYVFDEDAVIGKSRERSVLHEEMRRDAAQQILLRLQGT